MERARDRAVRGESQELSILDGLFFVKTRRHVDNFLVEQTLTDDFFADCLKNSEHRDVLPATKLEPPALLVYPECHA